MAREHEETFAQERRQPETWWIDGNEAFCDSRLVVDLARVVAIETGYEQYSTYDAWSLVLVGEAGNTHFSISYRTPEPNLDQFDPFSRFVAGLVQRLSEVNPDVEVRMGWAETDLRSSFNFFRTLAIAGLALAAFGWASPETIPARFALFLLLLACAMAFFAGVLWLGVRQGRRDGRGAILSDVIALFEQGPHD